MCETTPVKGITELFYGIIDTREYELANKQLDDPNFWDDYVAGNTAISPFLVSFAERALVEARLPTGARVLDIATGTGTMAVVAARAGMNVVATDFSSGMVQQVASYRIPNIEVRQMDGQALDLPDASFDAAFSMFGITLFDDWRAGLSEMARVVRPGGIGSIGTWPLPGGAAGSLLLAQLCTELFPEISAPKMASGLVETSNPERFRAALQSVQFTDVRIIEATYDYPIYAEDLENPDRLFTFSSQWKLLDNWQHLKIISTIESRRPQNSPYVVPSTAAIATARRL
jgi:ubiquinone/menaquinone biosynthesis C-methylase UbiE